MDIDKHVDELVEKLKTLKIQVRNKKDKIIRIRGMIKEWRKEIEEQDISKYIERDYAGYLNYQIEVFEGVIDVIHRDIKANLYTRLEKL